MGLDLVEMVMHIEEEFEIIIADEEAEKMTTPREVIEFLMRKPKIGERRSRDSVADAVWQIVEYETSIEREDFNEDSRFTEDMGLD